MLRSAVDDHHSPVPTATAGYHSAMRSHLPTCFRACECSTPHNCVWACLLLEFFTLFRFDQPTRSGGEVAVLQALTQSLGPGVWLNTIIALTHSGAVPPSSARGPLTYDAYAAQRSHLLQLIIRNASGDARLMNPIAYVESHPDCPRNEQVHSLPHARL
jgi:hypothetical protein